MREVEPGGPGRPRVHPPGGRWHGDRGVFAATGQPRSPRRSPRNHRSPRLPNVCLVFGVSHDRQAERAGIGQGGTQDRRGAVGSPSSRSRRRPRRRAHRAPPAAPPPADGDRPVASSSTGEPEAAAAARTREDAGFIERGLGVGHGADGREAAVGRRGQPGCHGLGVLVARLAEMGVQVDEPGATTTPSGTDAVGLGTLEPGDGFEDAAANNDLARPFPPDGRIDQPGAADLEVGATALSGRPASRPAGRAPPSGPRRRWSPGR